MIAQAKEIVVRSHATLIEDLLGVTALFAALFFCLTF